MDTHSCPSVHKPNNLLCAPPPPNSHLLNIFPISVFSPTFIFSETSFLSSGHRAHKFQKSSFFYFFISLFIPPDPHLRPLCSFMFTPHTRRQFCPLGWLLKCDPFLFLGLKGSGFSMRSVWQKKLYKEMRNKKDQKKKKKIPSRVISWISLWELLKMSEQVDAD